VSNRHINYRKISLTQSCDGNRGQSNKCSRETSTETIQTERESKQPLFISANICLKALHYLQATFTQFHIQGLNLVSD